MKSVSRFSALTLLVGVAAASSAAPAFALPVLNLNAPGAETLTAFPDHGDPNLYYLAPAVMLISKDFTGRPNFSYLEYRDGLFSKKALVQATLKPLFSEAELEVAKAGILAFNPKARFTALPFISSNLRFEGALAPLVEMSSCEHKGGLTGEEQVCAVRLNSKGRKVLRAQFSAGLTLTAHLEFQLEGVFQTPTGTFEPKNLSYTLGGRIGGPELGQYPGMFRDSRGREIRFPKPGHRAD